MPILNTDSTITFTSVTTGVALSASVQGSAALSAVIPQSAALSLTVSGRPGYAVMYVSGPPGVVSGIWPIIYDPYTKYVSFDTAILSGSVAGVGAINGQTGDVNIYGTGGNIFVTASDRKIYISGSGFLTNSDLTGLSGALSAQIGLTGSNLYNLITGLSGALSGGGIGDVTQAELNATGAKITALSGYVDAQISGLSGLLEQTGSQAWNAAQNNALNLSGVIQQSGSNLYTLTTGASGYLLNLINSTSGGVTLLNGLSGSLTLQGTGNVSVTANGQTIIVSGNTGDYASFALRDELTQTGVLLGGQITSLSGFVTGASGALQTQLDLLSGATGLAATGSYLYGLLTGLSGQAVTDYATKTQLTQTGVDLIARDLLISGVLATGIANTGQQAWTAAQNNALNLSGTIALTGAAAIGYADGVGTNLSGNLTLTGQTLQGRIDSLSGFVGNVSGGLEARIVETGNAAVVHANGIGSGLSGNLTLTGQTLDNKINALSGFVGNVSGGLETRIFATGSAAVSHANSIGQTISGNLTLTGQALGGKINSLSGFVGNVSGGLEVRITATGNSAVIHANGIGSGLSGNLAQTGATLLSHINSVGQTISGNLTQTGITLHTQTTGLSGYMIGLIQAASAGVSALNGLSGVLTIDGTGSITVFTVGNSILISGDSDPTFYATVPFVTGVSGALEVRITATGDAAVAHANGIGINLSGNLAQTGSILDGKINSLSGFVTTSYITTGQTGQFYPASNPQQYATSGDVVATGNAAVAHANGIGINLSGNLTLTGQTLQGRITSLSGFVGNVSGGLEARITQTGNAAVAHANSIGQTISGNLTQTGVTLQGRITSLSGFVGNVSGGLEIRIAQTGSAAVVHANGMGTIISGNLTQTGILLGQQIAALSGFATGANGGVFSYLTGLLPTGLDTYYIWHPVVFPTIPRVNVTFELSGAANGLYGVAISGRSTTGFYALLTDTVDTSGVFLDVVVKT